MKRRQGIQCIKSGVEEEGNIIWHRKPREEHLRHGRMTLNLKRKHCKFLNSTGVGFGPYVAEDAPARFMILLCASTRNPWVYACLSHHQAYPSWAPSLKRRRQANSQDQWVFWVLLGLSITMWWIFHKKCWEGLELHWHSDRDIKAKWLWHLKLVFDVRKNIQLTIYALTFIPLINNKTWFQKSQDVESECKNTGWTKKITRLFFVVHEDATLSIIRSYDPPCWTWYRDLC